MSKIPNSSFAIIGKNVFVTCFNPMEKCLLNKMTDNPCVQFFSTNHNGILEGCLSSCISRGALDLYSQALDVCRECCIKVAQAKEK